MSTGAESPVDTQARPALGPASPFRSMVERAVLRGGPINDDPLAGTAALSAAGFTDGLPVVAPTAERVDAFLAAAPPCGNVVGPVPLRFEPPATWDLAANAVMAGCRPAWFPIVLAALEALTAPAFNLLGVQSTTSGVAPMLIVGGPVVAANGLSSGPNAMAGAAVPNMAVGRAVRLTLQNVGNVAAGVPNPATVGNPGKTSWCIAETGDGSPWPPLHTALAPDAASAVTGVAAVGSVEVIFDGATVDDDIETLAFACAAVQRAGSSHLGGRRPVVAVVPPETAHRLAAAGIDRGELQRRLLAAAVIPVNALPAAVRNRAGDVTAVGASQVPEDFLIVVCGATGIKGAVVPTWGAGAAVTAEIRIGLPGPAPAAPSSHDRGQERGDDS